MSQNELKRAKKKPQLAKMSQNEPKRAKMSQKRVRMGQNGRIRARLGTSGHISGPKTTDFGPTRESLKPGLIWDSPLNGATFLVICRPKMGACLPTPPTHPSRKAVVGAARTPRSAHTEQRAHRAARTPRSAQNARRAHRAARRFNAQRAHRACAKRAARTLVAL